MTRGVVRRSPDVVHRELEDGGVLLDLRTGGYFGLNETGSAVWELLADATTVDALVAELARRVDGVPSSVDDEVWSFLDELAARGLVLVGPAGSR